MNVRYACRHVWYTSSSSSLTVLAAAYCTAVVRRVCSLTVALTSALGVQDKPRWTKAAQRNVDTRGIIHGCLFDFWGNVCHLQELLLNHRYMILNLLCDTIGSTIIDELGLHTQEKKLEIRPHNNAQALTATLSAMKPKMPKVPLMKPPTTGTISPTWTPTFDTFPMISISLMRFDACGGVAFGGRAGEGLGKSRGPAGTNNTVVGEGPGLGKGLRAGGG